MKWAILLGMVGGEAWVEHVACHQDVDRLTAGLACLETGGIAVVGVVVVALLVCPPGSCKRFAQALMKQFRKEFGD